ncbi:hypothetical protein HMN09_00185600 [Mycena chlorophos]|uniref:Uncharacterized protein n=1 Tax=Mycena chlorophos TaxID=658473 RepID=A0A8H6WKQ3_MYCCL|nr:hypothetical protein HMN09_00185600 [Mycena chlorophos]
MYTPSIISNTSSSSAGAGSICTYCQSSSNPSSPTIATTSEPSSPSSTKFRYGGRGGAGSRMRSPTSLPANSMPSSPACTCGRKIPVSRTMSALSSSTASSSENTPTKVRYGGRGGAGSRTRIVSPAPKSPAAQLPSLRRTKSVPKLALPPAPTKELPPLPSSEMFSSELAKRRGTTPAPLNLRRQPSMVSSPPLSASSTSSSASTNNADASGTPRTPYFYFDEAFEAIETPAAPSLVRKPSKAAFSRSLRGFKSRTQVLLSSSKDLFKPPSSAPPCLLPAQTTPVLVMDLPPVSPISLEQTQAQVQMTKPQPSPTFSTSSSSDESSVHSQWFDPPESPTHLEDGEADLIMVELPPRRSRNRSASQATVKAAAAAASTKGDRLSACSGRWNRSDMREVIKELRML